MKVLKMLAIVVAGAWITSCAPIAATKTAGEEALRAQDEAKREEEARESAALQPGQEFRDCQECPEMVVVPTGTFMMGSPASERGRRDSEGPQHRVTIVKPFAVGKYEVTFEEWDACAASGGCSWHRPRDRGWGQGNRPVIYVSWNDANAYVRWLSRQTGEVYRLLSESEWEYTARAGTVTQYHWGVSVSYYRANCAGCGSRWDSRSTAPVGSFRPNEFGLHDMHGNVWEWVEDCWHLNYLEAPSDGSAWTTGGNCSRSVVRGGSWNNIPENLRAAIRSGNETYSRIHNVGFRGRVRNVLQKGLRPMLVMACR